MLTSVLGLGACDATPPDAPADGQQTQGQRGEQGDAAPPLGMLPDGAVPTRYRIALVIDPSYEQFRGEATIDLTLAAPTRRLWLHTRDLTVEHIDVRDAAGIREDIEPSALRQVTADGVAAFELDTPLAAGPVALTFRYVAPFNPDLAGLYRVHVGDRFYAFTQFQDIGARSVFPAFDEPRFKTPFDIRVTVPAASLAIGSTPIVETHEDGGNRTVVFAETPPLPTYLVALAVGPFDMVAGPDIAPSELRAAPIPVQGVSVNGRGDEIRIALAETPALVAEHERYFGVAYPFRKLDLAAVPDFQAGAMENVGLITFRDELLLMGDHPSPAQREAYRYVQSHELAHQWFGNLVTPRWWDDLWLNESFATWAGARAADAVFAERGFRSGQLANTLNAMREDSLASARSMREPITTSGDIANAFDSITYAKGAGVLRMFEGYLGADEFRQAVHRHLERFRFGTATADDFVQSLAGPRTGDRLRESFMSFIEQPGVPLIRVEVACEEDHNELVLTQTRYRPLGSPIDAGGQWHVPFCFTAQADGRTIERCELFDAREQHVPLEACPTWLIPNRDGDGYYRFALDAHWTEKLLAVFDEALGDDEQMVVVDAVAAAFANGSLEVPELLDSARIFAEAKNRYAVETSLEPLEWLHRRAGDAERRVLEGVFRAAYESRRAALAAREDADAQSRQLEDTLTVFLALEGRDASLRTELAAMAQRFAAALATTPDARYTDTLPAAFRIALETGVLGARDLVALLGHTARGEIRSAALQGLGAAETEDAHRAATALLIQDTLKNNEYIDLLAALAEGRHLDATWTWLRDHIDEVMSRLPESDRQYFPGIFAELCSDQRAAEVEAFFEPRLRDVRGGDRPLRQTVEAVGICAAKWAHHRPALERFAASDTAAASMED